MRSFGKSPNAVDIALLIQPGKQPISCRIIERTLRIVRLTVPDYAKITLQFQLIYDNGQELAFCNTVSTGENFIVARYTTQKGDNREVMISSVGATLGEAERWRGGT